jgi:hypothetical protein
MRSSHLKPSNGLIGLVRSNADNLDAVFLAKTPADCRLGQVCLPVQHTGRWTGVFLGRSHNDASVSLPATNGWSMSSNARIPTMIRLIFALAVTFAAISAASAEGDAAKGEGLPYLQALSHRGHTDQSGRTSSEGRSRTKRQGLPRAILIRLR